MVKFLVCFLSTFIISGLSFSQYFTIKDLGWAYSAAGISGTIALINTSEVDFEVQYVDSGDDLSVLSVGTDGIELLKPGQCIIGRYYSKILYHRFVNNQADFLCNYEQSSEKELFKVRVRITANSADTALEKYSLWFHPDLSFLNYVWQNDLPCLTKDSTLAELDESLDSLFIDPEICSLFLTPIANEGNIISGSFVLRNPTKNRYLINSVSEETTSGRIWIGTGLNKMQDAQERRLHPYNFILLRFRLENPEYKLLKNIGEANALLNFVVEVQGDSSVRTIQIPFKINHSNLVISYMNNGVKKKTWLE